MCGYHDVRPSANEHKQVDASGRRRGRDCRVANRVNSERERLGATATKFANSSLSMRGHRCADETLRKASWAPRARTFVRARVARDNIIA